MKTGYSQGKRWGWHCYQCAAYPTCPDMHRVCAICGDTPISNAFTIASTSGIKPVCPKCFAKVARRIRKF